MNSPNRKPQTKDFRHPSKERRIPPLPKPLGFAFCAQLTRGGPLDILATTSYRDIQFAPWDTYTSLITPEGEILDAHFRTPDEAFYWFKKIKTVIMAANEVEKDLPSR